MANLCIIPARGGSKRIPGKNRKEFLGKPVMAYSIEAALNSGLFDEVMVSTDDAELAAIARHYGAKVPFLRSEATAGDTATTMDVLKEVETAYQSQLNQTFQYICCIYATAPLINIEHLKNGFNLLKENRYDAVYPVVAFSYPIWRAVRMDDKQHTQMIWPEHVNTRSQDLETAYHDAGQWYWYNPRTVNGTLLNGRTGSIILSEMEVQDIDTPTDWQLAELKYELLQKTR